MNDRSLARLDAVADGGPSRWQDAPIWLFTPYYKAGTQERQGEIDHCLENNLACGAFDRVVLLVDDGHVPPFQDPRLTVWPVAQRPTYRLWLDCSRELGLRGISVLANSDIYFDETLPQVRHYLTRPQQFMALSRHDKIDRSFIPHPNPKWSQDVWALDTRSELSSSLVKALDIPLGVPRCDNKVAYLFAVHGWEVFNPMAHVRSVHVHETQQRSYDKHADLTVIGAVAYVRPTAEHGVPSEVEIDVWARRSQAIAGVTLNRSLDLWAQSEASASATSPANMQAAPSAARSLLVPPKTPVLDKRPSAAAVRADGEVVFSDTLGRFTVLHHAGRLHGVDRLRPATLLSLRARSSTPSPEDILAAFVPPVLPTEPIIVRDRPQSGRDSHFWQYPAATERQAYENHRSIGLHANVDAQTRRVHAYLGLPWATYIDRKDLPSEVTALMAPRVRGLVRLARELGYELAVHTVCQQIYWRRMLETFQTVGITDLHLSHDVESLHTGDGPGGLRIHSWPLIAPNIEDPQRRAGLVIGKPVAKRRYLASFVGAHMPHYRSDVRVRLLQAARECGRADVVVSLGDEWHFNRVVYDEQVKRKALDAAHGETQDAAVRNYNELLSDSIFSLCPEGAGPNTLRVWESLAVGAIPVIFAPDWRPPAASQDGPDLRDCALFVRDAPDAGLFDRLAAIPLAEREHMQRTGIALYARVRDKTAFDH